MHSRFLHSAAITICVMTAACSDKWESSVDKITIPVIPNPPKGGRMESADQGFVTGGHLHGGPALDLKPGFYSGNDPRWERLNRFVDSADVHLDISWHAGISFGKRSNLTLEDLAAEMKSVKSKQLASIFLEKNYTDDTRHLKVEKLLFDLGFEQVVITRAHSSGTYLESCRQNATPATSSR